jgi:dipeptide/tripeptide permease
MLKGNGVPNDVISNFNSLSIIVMGPCLNYGLYPALRKARIHYGPVARITTGFAISTLAGVGYTILCWRAYKTNPCGYYGSTDPVCVDGGLVSPISLWWAAIPYALGGFSELFINVPGKSFQIPIKQHKSDSNTTISLRYCILPRTYQHERFGVSHQPPEQRVCICHQLGSLLGHH